MDTTWNTEFQKKIEETDLGKYLKSMQIKGFQDFSFSAVMQYGTEEKLAEANKVIEVLHGMMRKKHLLGNNNSTVFVAMMETAAFIHNLFVPEGDVTLEDKLQHWSYVFRAREILEPLAETCGIDVQLIPQIFQTVEAQLGDDLPVDRCRPVPNTPIELFAWAVWFVEEFNHAADQEL